MPQRLRYQERSIGPIGRLDVPAGKIAAGRGLAVVDHCGADHQQRADRKPIGFQKITIFWQTGRRFTAGQTLQSLLPELEPPIGESARQQCGNGGNVGVTDLMAANFRQKVRPLVPAANGFVNWIVILREYNRG